MPVQTVRRPRTAADIGVAALERKAGEAAGLLKLLANENRLLILCRLASREKCRSAISRKRSI